MPPELNEKRAQFVLAKIDQILDWERQTDRERDTRFVELGRYLCEVRAGQYWRLEKLASFDDYLARRFAESRRKAYYLMSIHEARGPGKGTGTCRSYPGFCPPLREDPTLSVSAQGSAPRTSSWIHGRCPRGVGR